MPCEAIICDWNGTIIEYRDEKPILKSIATGLFKDAIPFHPLRIVCILRAQQELERLYRERRRGTGFDFVREMFRVFNGKIVGGVPIHLIRRSVEGYAAEPRTQGMLDQRILRPVGEAHQAGKVTGIFSAGYRYGIERILTVAGYHECFDFYEADDFREENGKAIEFALRIYRNKPMVLLNLLRDRNLDARRVAYLGDSEDDEGCFEIVKYPIVPFLAPEELKQRYAQKYQAFVPDSEKDLADYLRNA
jgi:hypothetical protein